MSFFQKLCPAPFPPFSCSFPEPCTGSQCCLYNLLEVQPESILPLGGKYCIVSNPSRDSGLLPCFLQHVHCSYNRFIEPARVGDRHTMSARSPSVGDISSREIGLPGIMSPTLRVSSAGPNPCHLSPKVTNIFPNQISSLLLWNIWSIATYQFVLKPLTNSYNQDPAPCSQHLSTSLIIKILLIPLTGPDNPLLCHYFCYYLKWVNDN